MAKPILATPSAAPDTHANMRTESGRPEAVGTIFTANGRAEVISRGQRIEGGRAWHALEVVGAQHQGRARVRKRTLSSGAPLHVDRARAGREGLVAELDPLILGAREPSPLRVDARSEENRDSALGECADPARVFGHDPTQVSRAGGRPAPRSLRAPYRCRTRDTVPPGDPPRSGCRRSPSSRVSRFRVPPSPPSPTSPAIRTHSNLDTPSTNHTTTHSSSGIRSLGQAPGGGG